MLSTAKHLRLLLVSSAGPVIVSRAQLAHYPSDPPESRRLDRAFLDQSTDRRHPSADSPAHKSVRLGAGSLRELKQAIVRNGTPRLKGLAVAALSILIARAKAMSVTDLIYRKLKYAISKARNARNSEPVPSPAIVDRESMAKLTAELRTCGYNLANCAKRLGVVPRCGVNFSWALNCDTWGPRKQIRLTPWSKSSSADTKCRYLASQLISHPNPWMRPRK